MKKRDKKTEERLKAKLSFFLKEKISVLIIKYYKGKDGMWVILNDILDQGHKSNKRCN